MAAGRRIVEALATGRGRQGDGRGKGHPCQKEAQPLRMLVGFAQTRLDASKEPT
jgi:hypothetical protein